MNSAALSVVALLSLISSPTSVADQFEMPAGFRIYKVASGEVCGGSYDLTFDGDGRLLVGDGTQVRRLIYNPSTKLYDGFEIVATGLGPRGPQGLVVVGDRLYAVGGDGIQMYEGYTEESDNPLLRHVGRIGEPFRTGGDHAAHSIFRGHDDRLYFITGDGGGLKDRLHITESNSSVLFERNSSVFRISLDGNRWECIGSGGRNAPNVGMNYLGDFFSLDSDMEWHVDLPFWRPVRLNHWVVGGDQGWQRVGAYPPYFIDGLPGIHDVGRGSPNWGVFYEHTQFPERYQNAYFVCDYRSKSATSGGYTTVGRLYAILLTREAARWSAEVEVFAIPRDGGVDAQGQPIDFALVDIEVGPDGSLYLTDHSQGIWRIVYDPNGQIGAPEVKTPAMLAKGRSDPLPALEELLALPQPSSEWSRVRREQLREELGGRYLTELMAVASATDASLGRRLRVLRYLSPHFNDLPRSFVDKLAADASPEMRGQAAWLIGLRGERAEVPNLVSNLLTDGDAFVRRRALEALLRNPPSAAQLRPIVYALEDRDRTIRYLAMVVLSHHPTETWFDDVRARLGFQSRMRALVAAHLRREPATSVVVRLMLNELMDQLSINRSVEDRLDLLRLLGLFRAAIEEDVKTRRRTVEYLLSGFPDRHRDIRWEQARLLGEYRVTAAFDVLLAELRNEKDYVTQFHLAQALARLPSGWKEESRQLAVDWFLSTQRGWFAEFTGKGRQFPDFWATALADFGTHHRDAILEQLERIDWRSQIGTLTLALLAEAQDVDTLVRVYRGAKENSTKISVVSALGALHDEEVSAFLREEFGIVGDPKLHGWIVRALAKQPPFPPNRSFLEDGLLHEDRYVVRECALSLTRFRSDLSQDVVQTLVSRMLERRDIFRACERLLVAMTGTQPESYNAKARVDRNAQYAEREASVGFWKSWYAEQFEEEFEPLDDGVIVERESDEIRKFLLSAQAKGGRASRGERIYEALCVKCHGGMSKGVERSAVFGPDLTGVTRRLKREEFVDSLVYPSKLVAERFKATVLQSTDGVVLTGFVTEQSDQRVTLVTQDRVHRIARDKVALLAPQDTSLMPEGLLERLHDDELRDLLAFLEQLGARTPKEPVGALGAPPKINRK